MKTKVLIVPDSFKGSLSAVEVARAINVGLQKTGGFILKSIPVSDGGEGALEILYSFNEYQKSRLSVFGAYGRPKQTEFLIDKEGHAYIEVAGATGISGISRDKLNPLIASSYGTGQVIKEALSLGCQVVNLFLGGSATVDGGTGMLAALGADFYLNNQILNSHQTNPLVTFQYVKCDKAIQLLANANVKLITDVINPVIGEGGAARIFGPQKGASDQNIVDLEERMKRWVHLLEEKSSKQLAEVAGLGAAGGIGLPLMAFGNTEIISGSEWFIKKLQVQKWIEWADVVITGEGSIDHQTTMGKIPGSIAQMGGYAGKKVIGLCGKVGEPVTGFDRIISLTEEFNVTEAVAIENAFELLVRAANKIGDWLDKQN